MPQTFTVDKEYHNARLDRWFKANVVSLPQSLIEKIIRLNKIKINRKKVKSSYRIQSGDIIEVYDISKFKVTNRPKILKYKPSKITVVDINENGLTELTRDLRSSNLLDYNPAYITYPVNLLSNTFDKIFNGNNSSILLISNKKPLIHIRV